MTESPLVDSSLAISVFSPRDDPIACLNKAIAFLTVIASSRFPSTNNQLRTSSNLKNQDTIQDGWVRVQQVQGIQGGHARVVKCYNCQGEGHMARQCTQPKRPRNVAWYKDIAMLAEAQEAGQILDKEQLAFLADPGVLDGQAVQTIIPNNAAFQSEDLDSYDSDCNDISNAKAVLMDNISNYGSDVILVDFRKRFVLEHELSAVNAFWYHMLNPSTKTSDALPIKIEAPKELPKVSLVNESLKKLKLHLANFNKVVKIRTTPNARTEGEWGFEHTKAIFNNEIIPFLKSLKDIFNVFDKDLLNEIIEVQTVFDQMDVVVQQSSFDKQCLKIAKKELLLEINRLLQQIMSQDVLLNVTKSIFLNDEAVNMERKRNESCDTCFNLDAELLKSQNAHNDLLKSYSQLEKRCISLESSIQLNQEIFQKHKSCDNQNALEILIFFENNDLKAQLQDKDTTICKLKEIIKSMREKSKEKNVNYDYCEIETKNVELENSVSKLVYENEHLCKEINQVKQVFKDQFELIKKTCIHTKDQSDSLIDKLNLNFAKNKDLKAQIQDKGIVKQAKVKQPLDKELDFACKHAQRIQELLVYVRDTCLMTYPPLRLEGVDTTLHTLTYAVILYQLQSTYLLSRQRKATPTLRLRSPRVRRQQERVVGFEDAPKREGNKRGRNTEGIRHLEIEAREGENRGANLPLLLAAHLGRNENSQPLRSSLTSVQGGHQPSTSVKGNLPPNGSLLSHHAQTFITSSFHIPTRLTLSMLTPTLNHLRTFSMNKL
nr:hypothetical protein [Tanacetum cinerariifolium]